MFEGRKQEGGDNSSNFQSDNLKVTNNYGLSYRDAKDIALDVFKANYKKFRQEAASIAETRAEEITTMFLSKLYDETPQAINNFNDPGVQMALFKVQTEYVKSGDLDTGKLLTEALIKRTLQKDKNFHQILLDEALLLIPKLTQTHSAIINKFHNGKYEIQS